MKTPGKDRPDSFALHRYARRQRSRLMGVLFLRLVRGLTRALRAMTARATLAPSTRTPVGTTQRLSRAG